MFSAHLLMWNFFLVGIVGAAASRSAQDTGFPQPPSDPLLDALHEDALTQHMSKLYEKYNRENRLKEGNTVRSVRASQDPSDHRRVYRLNLTTLQDSEVVLSATFHFLLDRRPHHKPWFCKRFRSPSCRTPAVHPSQSVSLLLRAVSPGSGVGSGSMGLLLGNVTFHPHRRGVWQMKDVTQVIKEARDKGHLLLSVELGSGRSQQRKPEQEEEEEEAPYLLVYANDSALAEPNSVSASLQRYDPLGDGGERQANVPPGRARREAAPLPEPIQNNELPEVDYRPDAYRKDDLWESAWYMALKPKHKPSKPEKKRKSQGDGEGDEQQGEGRGASEGAKSDDAKRQTPAAEGRRHERRDGKRHKGGAQGQSPVLSFDEQTMRKARRRQWAEAQQRGCSRRNLRVDFADIGWSEWVMAPKAFDAYYCAGTCGFPMPKLARPSNHATIQSIVRAVGIIPGIPEPCCVPEKMSPLAVLYQDEARNPVLKIYPNMSVQSCSCR